MGAPRLARTKIVATLGPATESAERIEELVEAGVNVFRLNMSHLDHEKAELLIDRIRAVSDRVAIMADLQGPKMRVTDVGEPFELAAGDTVRVAAGEEATSRECLYVPAGDLVAILAIGHRVLIDDGRIRLEVTQTREGSFDALVTAGGVVRSRKGIACPDVRYRPETYLNRGDIADAAFAVERGVDYMAASYVSDADDVEALRETMGVAGDAIGIIAKIESRMGVQNIDAILGAAGEGDIGQHFPNSDPTWKGADSVTLLTRAAEIVREAGYSIVSVDAVVVAERPTLSAYVQRMRNNVAVAVGVDVGRVGLKGKTNEGMDATGAGEAIAVHAVALLSAN